MISTLTISLFTSLRSSLCNQREGLSFLGAFRNATVSPKAATSADSSVIKEKKESGDGKLSKLEMANQEEDEKLVPSNADPSTGETVMTREMFVGLDVGVPLDETVGEEAVEDGVRLL